MALPAPAAEFARVDFPADSDRAGILGQATFLALTSKPGETSPTSRGVFVREQFLCQKVPDPPPGVNSNLPPVTADKPQTNRERMAAHATRAALRRLPPVHRSHRLRSREIRRRRRAAAKS